MATIGLMPSFPLPLKVASGMWTWERPWKECRRLRLSQGLRRSLGTPVAGPATILKAPDETLHSLV